MKLIYPAIFSPCLEKEGYTVIVPDLPGCVSEGNNLVEAIDMATDAASGWILDELEEGNKIPKPSDPLTFNRSDGEFVNFLVLDMGSYAAKYGNNSIRKNLTIPAWLHTMAEKENINFSQVLQEALENKLNINS